MDAAHVRVGPGGFGAPSRLSGGTRHAKTNAADAEIIVFQDEAHIRDYQAIGATWYLQGQPKRVLTPDAILFGAVAPATGQVVIAEADQTTAQIFQVFLGTVLPTLQDQTIHPVLDLCRSHFSNRLVARDYADLRDIAMVEKGCHNRRFTVGRTTLSG